MTHEGECRACLHYWLTMETVDSYIIQNLVDLMLICCGPKMLEKCCPCKMFTSWIAVEN